MLYRATGNVLHVLPAQGSRMPTVRDRRKIEMAPEAGASVHLTAAESPPAPRLDFRLRGDPQRGRPRFSWDPLECNRFALYELFLLGHRSTFDWRKLVRHLERP